MNNLRFRLENERDINQIETINRLAFGRATEATLVNRLRQEATPFISLVAEQSDGRLAGHLLFTGVNVVGDEPPAWEAIALGPVAVLPERQRQGVGKGLIRHGLHHCQTLGHAVVFVLGHADYYPQFGFLPAFSHNIQCEFDVPPELFMVAERQPNALDGRAGVVYYHPAFQGV